MMTGIAAAGDRPRLRSALTYTRPEGEVSVFYGLAGSLAKALKEVPAKGGKAVYVDLGYWGRKDGGRFAGYHKLSVNGRHPTSYFQAVKHDAKRAQVFGLRPKPWQKRGGHILLAGMGPKGARAEGFKALGWEEQALAAIRQATDRRVIYRPKPNWERAPGLPGTTMAPAGQDLEDALRDCHAVVAHHSNAAVEAITAGIPAFVVEGIALPMGRSDLSLIEQPAYPAGRAQWLADAAYTQWSIAEMASGAAWAHLKDEGLI
jgi:hypothetical protein